MLAAGEWIDDVPNIPGAPPTPEMAVGDLRRRTATVTDVDECAQMRFYRGA